MKSRGAGDVWGQLEAGRAEEQDDGRLKGTQNCGGRRKSQMTPKVQTRCPESPGTPERPSGWKSWFLGELMSLLRRLHSHVLRSPCARRTRSSRPPSQVGLLLCPPEAERG